MPILCRKAVSVSVLVCGLLLFAFGITGLVLGIKGYFSFEDPCIDVKSFEILNIDLEHAEGGNPFLETLDSFTFGMASRIAPSKATMELEMVLEVNNTNPYDLDYEQGEEGLIDIPAEKEGSAVTDDLVVGVWSVPTGILKARARNEIPVSVTTSIDLLSADTVGLASKFVSGKTVVFRISGGIEGSSWIPGVTGTSSLLCLANVEDIMDFESGTTVKCTHTTKAGRFIDESGEIDFSAFDDEEVDPACLVK